MSRHGSFSQSVSRDKVVENGIRLVSELDSKCKLNSRLSFFEDEPVRDGETNDFQEIQQKDNFASDDGIRYAYNEPSHVSDKQHNSLPNTNLTKIRQGSLILGKNCGEYRNCSTDSSNVMHMNVAKPSFETTDHAFIGGKSEKQGSYSSKQRFTQFADNLVVQNKSPDYDPLDFCHDVEKDKNTTCSLATDTRHIGFQVKCKDIVCASDAKTPNKSQIATTEHGWSSVVQNNVQEGGSREFYIENMPSSLLEHSGNSHCFVEGHVSKRQGHNPLEFCAMGTCFERKIDSVVNVDNCSFTSTDEIMKYKLDAMAGNKDLSEYSSYCVPGSTVVDSSYDRLAYKHDGSSRQLMLSCFDGDLVDDSGIEISQSNNYSHLLNETSAKSSHKRTSKSGGKRLEVKDHQRSIADYGRNSEILPEDFRKNMGVHKTSSKGRSGNKKEKSSDSNNKKNDGCHNDTVKVIDNVRQNREKNKQYDQAFRQSSFSEFRKALPHSLPHPYDSIRCMKDGINFALNQHEISDESKENARIGKSLDDVSVGAKENCISRDSKYSNRSFGFEATVPFKSAQSDDILNKFDSKDTFLDSTVGATAIYNKQTDGLYKYDQSLSKVKEIPIHMNMHNCDYMVYTVSKPNSGTDQIYSNRSQRLSSTGKISDTAGKRKTDVGIIDSVNKHFGSVDTKAELQNDIKSYGSLDIMFKHVSKDNFKMVLVDDELKKLSKNDKNLTREDKRDGEQVLINGTEKRIEHLENKELVRSYNEVCVEKYKKIFLLTHYQTTKF